MLIMNLGHSNREYLIFVTTRGEHDAAIVLIYYRFSIKTHVKYYVGRLPALRKQGQTASCELNKK